jgi:hypothetical protein
MKYLFETFDESNNRVETDTRVETVKIKSNETLKVTNQLSGEVFWLENQNDLEEWQASAAMGIWRRSLINPFEPNYKLGNSKFKYCCYSKEDKEDRIIDSIDELDFENVHSIKVLVGADEFFWIRNKLTFVEWKALLNKDVHEHKWEPFKEAGITMTNHIDPKHYQGYITLESETLQWIETMQYLPRFSKDPECFKAALELQVRKYLDRNGKKDTELQELKKARWYLDFLIKYVENGDKPVRI